MYPIIGYPSEHSGGISASAPFCSVCHRTIPAYSNFGRVLLWHTPDLFQSGKKIAYGKVVRINQRLAVIADNIEQLATYRDRIKGRGLSLAEGSVLTAIGKLDAEASRLKTRRAEILNKYFNLPKVKPSKLNIDMAYNEPEWYNPKECEKIHLILNKRRIINEKEKKEND